MNISLLQNSPSEKQTIIMLHGFSADKMIWLRFARFFTKKYHVIIPDLAGHGDTGFDKDWDYSGPAQAERIVKLLDKLSLEKVHVVGNSMGGFIAAHFAKMYPDRTLSITLIDPAGVVSPANDIDKILAQNNNPFDVNNRAEFDTLYAMTMEKPPKVPNFVIASLSEQYQQHKVELMHIFYQFYGQHMLDDNLGDIRAPTLLLWGEKDQLIHVESVKVWQAGIKNITVKIWSDIGHMPMVEIPQESAQECLCFLKEIDDKTS
jgi:pimeloyl-ACP methyl ester carboxylesterase